MTHTIRTALLAAIAASSMISSAAAAAAPLALAASITVQNIDELNATYTEILESYIVERDGIHLFNYSGVSNADRERLQAYIAGLEALKPSGMSDDDQIAYWANLYNAKTLDIILENYPVASIRDIKSGFFSSGPWGMEVVTVEGKNLSLDNIEHDIVRANFDEPRVHYAFNCASIGCPNLAMKAWDGSTLDEDLDAAARAYIAHPRGVSVDGDKVTASSIYKWFKEDFGRTDGDVLDHIRQYATGEKLTALESRTRINKHEYDWSLNDTE